MKYSQNVAKRIWNRDITFLKVQHAFKTEDNVQEPAYILALPDIVKEHLDSSVSKNFAMN